MVETGRRRRLFSRRCLGARSGRDELLLVRGEELHPLLSVRPPRGLMTAGHATDGTYGTYRTYGSVPRTQI